MLKKKKGFALVLVIISMAFMVMLTLALSAIMSSKLRLLSAQKEARKARQNAVLGMSVAISKLQATLGKDNAISFPSSAFDQDPQTPSIEGVEIPFLVGALSVEKNNSSLSPKELQDEQREIVNKLKHGEPLQEIEWLVSSERPVKNPISERIEDLNKNTVVLAEYSALKNYPQTFGATVSGREKSEKVQVKAGKIRIGNSSAKGAQGAYAYYVSDESLKAKINISRPEKYINSKGESVNAGLANKFQAPSDTRIPQSVNLSFIEDFQGFTLNAFLNDYDEEKAKKIEKINSLDDLAIINSSLSQWAKENKNDFTASSVGIPADVTQGRLKSDLSAYMNGGFGLDDSEVVIRGNGKKSDAEYTGVNFGIKNYEEYLPRFGHLKDWANIAKGKDSFESGIASAQAPNLEASNPRHGISPVLSRVQFFFLPAYETVSKNGLWDFGGSVKISLMVYPRIWIWNPHNVAIEASDYKISLYAPLQFKLFDKNSESPKKNIAYTAYTRWRKYNIDEDGNPVLDEAWREKIPYISKTTTGYFGNFLNSSTAENGSPVLNFRVKNLKLLPGECVELTRAEDANEDGNGVALYKDCDIKSLGGNDNLLEAGKSVFSDGEYTESYLLQHKGFKIRLAGGNTDLLMSPDISQGKNIGELLKATYNKSENRLEYADEETKKKCYFVPVSALREENFDGLNLQSSPYFHANFYVNSGAWNSTAKSGVGSKMGYEILNARNERIFVNDQTEWSSLSSISKTSNKNGYRYEYFGTNGVERDRIYSDYGRVSSNTEYVAKENQYESMLVTELEILDKNPIRDNESFLRQNKIKYLFLGANHKKNAEDKSIWPIRNALFWGWGTTTPIFGFRIMEVGNMSNPIFRGGNLRAGSVVSSTRILKRAESTKSNPRNYSVGAKFSAACDIPHVFMGCTVGWISRRGAFTWYNGSKIKDSLIDTGDALIKKYSDFNDGNRYGHQFFLGGEGTYSYDYHACALFDYPRSEYDLLSLGVFSHANLSFFHGQPTYAFAESYAPPYLKREEIVDDGFLYANENIDISYILNASIWDRFYLSSLPGSRIKELKAGDRLANTRHFIKNVPQDHSDIAGSDNAFKKSAAYVGIDGAFNVNSTSYEAWRAFLGGMLGTQKTTLTNETINSESQSSSDGKNLSMPNPGSIKPICTPAKYDETSGKYLCYKDMMVGRLITEAEIDQLAREIVAEVKRRAPFFSLSDFVNRRLYKISEINADIDLSYQSLMGTLAAAIHRATQDESRPPNFFNDKSLDINQNMSSNGDITDINHTGTTESFTQTGTALTALNNGGKGGKSKDLGENVRENSKEFIENAFGAPIENNIWNWRIAGSRGLLSQADLLTMIAPLITVRGDTFTIRAYGESKNPMTSGTTQAYCEAVVQRASDCVNPSDDIVSPSSPFGRRFKIVSFKWLTPNEL